ncbi:M23 family metallopeptidase [Streptomyces sp. NPDC049879]|uniref:M23 family metallopeptidase n=1 Tax=Streptomyces sp. NPDC049879 TaxID=3365598 RepID=UPI00379B04F8
MHALTRILAGLGQTLWWAFIVLAVADTFADAPALEPVTWAALVLAVLLPPLARKLVPGPATAPEPVEVAPPVTGTWSALNSPADKVPSHGTRALGQAYAIDIVAERDDRPRPSFGWWPPTRRNAAFPAYGEPLYAVADATVVRAGHRRRDHLSRNSWPAMAYLLAEGLVRTLGGPYWIVGNHVLLDLGDGTYALYAHLRRGSLAVRPGERVRAGQLLARCGNSGNSTEPHLHFQLMDSADLRLARGIPFRWRGIGVPAARERFTAPGPAAR